MNNYTRSFPSRAANAEVVNAFMRGIYAWMGAGLALTAVLAWWVANTPAALGLLLNIDFATGTQGTPVLLYGLFLAELGIVFYLSARVASMNPGTATGLFLLYSGLNGVTLSPILLAYTGQSVAATFFVSAGMFGAMSLYGLLTKKDLTSWGSLLFMGLIGMIIAMVVNIFLQSQMMSFVISGVGVVLFTGLTAYDTQKFKTMGEVMPNDAAAVRRGSILGALTLYLDFINLFLMLLRIMGNRR
ncbi:Bax inhibitor-1/YccA family protein [Salidesulfovibrio onnuriiensis]|uniref:Bax inhibitor-1/YccA family protein n=1 Tax=Salidesulfovibrio onnuriiensis TaxID=2583823 RepID=UPI0011C8AA47|nr:Bax inhibitor-1/YccA family protein [Salidesulfovibrio onnuriiensis]